MAFIGRKPTNAPLTSDDIPNGIIGASDLATGLAKLTWDTTAKTSGFTASANTGYFCNTTSAAFTVTLPASPTAGDTIQLVDYAGTFDTNALTISPNGNKIEGGTSNLQLTGDREGVSLVYIDSTQGWLATSGINEGTDALSPISYSVDFLVVAGGGGGGSGQNVTSNRSGGGGGAGGYRNSYLTETSGGNGTSESSLTFTQGIVYTITVGAGGAGTAGDGLNGTVGVNSSISGTGISTITSSGGGFGGANSSNGGTGGSGGGAGANSGSGGSGTANQGFAGANSGGSNTSGGGGGASAVGTSGSGGNAGAGGNGLASSITGSSVTRAGGGGGGGNVGGAGGTGGGGTGGNLEQNGTAGTANTGGGGGGGGNNDSGTTRNGASGGKGVVILRIPTANYSGTTTGSPTVTTDGSDKVIVFNDSGSITG